jgi:hypothetical protein
MGTKELIEEIEEKLEDIIGIRKTLGKSYFCHNCSNWIVRDPSDCEDLINEVRQGRVRVGERLYERCRSRVEIKEELKSKLQQLKEMM